MKITFKSALVGAMALTLSAGASMAQEVTLRCQHFVSPKSAVPAGFIVPWAEKVMAESNGRIKIEVYPAMQLGGKPPALYDQIRDGVIDCGWALPAYTPGRFPETEVFELPFMTSLNAEASSRALWQFYEAHMQERLKDVHVVAMHVHGPGVIHKKGGPIETVADFKGLKLRGPSRSANTLLESLGSTPVGMPVPAFPEALSKGVVDGGVIPWEITVPLKVHELADSHTEVGGDRAMYNITFIWGMNKAKYNSLPDDLKAVIDANSGIEMSAWAGKAMDEGDIRSINIVKERGNTVATLSDATRGELETLGKAQVEAWIAEAEGKGLANARQMVEDARAMIASQAGN